MTSKLKIASLVYGSSRYDIAPHESLPIPNEFDFSNPIDCARRAMECMSNASGGHMIHDIKLSYSEKYQCANISGSGVHVFYSDGAKMTIDEVLDMGTNEMTQVTLGSVVSDQYSYGWRRAKWVLTP